MIMSSDVELKSVIDSFAAKLNYANIRIRRLEKKFEAFIEKPSENNQIMKSAVAHSPTEVHQGDTSAPVLD